MPKKKSENYEENKHNSSRFTKEYGGNLIPANMRDPEEAREIARRGGIKSGIVKRQKQTMRTCMQLLLELPASDRHKSKLLKKMGIEDDEISNRMLMMLALWEKACEGDVPAAKEIRTIMGELDIATEPVEEDNVQIIIKRAGTNVAKTLEIVNEEFDEENEKPKKNRKKVSKSSK